MTGFGTLTPANRAPAPAALVLAGLLCACATETPAPTVPHRQPSTWTVRNELLNRHRRGASDVLVQVVVGEAHGGRWFVLANGTELVTGKITLGSWGPMEQILRRSRERNASGAPYVLYSLAMTSEPHQIVWLPPNTPEVSWAPGLTVADSKFTVCEASGVAIDGVALGVPAESEGAGLGGSGPLFDVLPLDPKGAQHLRDDGTPPNDPDWLHEIRLTIVRCEQHEYPESSE